MTGHLDEAEHDLNTAIRLYTAEAIASNPDYGWKGEPYYWRGWIHKVRGQMQEALADLSLAVTLNPEFSGGYMERAEVLDLLGRESEATRDRKRPKPSSSEEKAAQRGRK